jgi:hypothetical protein
MAGNGQTTTATSSLKKLGQPNDQMGSADPLLTPPADRFNPQTPNGYMMSCLGASARICFGRCSKNIFQRIFMLKNIF